MKIRIQNANGESYKVSHRNLTDEQKKRITNWIFLNEGILKQIDESEIEDEKNDIQNYEEYIHYKNEVVDGK